MLEQKDLKLSDEVSRRWVAITDDSGIVDFDKREKKIHALEQVTKEQVQEWFNKLIFEETRRINIKMYSHQHWDQIEENKAKEAENL